MLVTGGCGFIGSHFIRYMLEKYRHCSIVNLDKLTYCGNLDNTRDLESNPRYSFVEGDICNKRLVSRLVFNHRLTAIVNFAAESHVDRSISDPNSFIETNVKGTLNLLNVAKTYGIQRFLQVSTDEVYGPVYDGLADEARVLRPGNPYAASKASAELLALSYFNTFGVPVVITRGANTFGPNQYPEKLIPLFVTNLLQGEKVPLYGNGRQIRDWLYVLDHCAGIDVVLHSGRVGEIYNISGRNLLPNIDIVNFILERVGKGTEWIEYVNDRPGHDVRYSIDSKKIRSLGWRRKYVFESALMETIDWYINHEDWWRMIKEFEFLN